VPRPAAGAERRGAEIRRRRRLFVAAAWVALALSAAAQAEGGARPAEPLQISVAISLLPAMREFATSGGPAMLLNAGGSGVLLQQARRGAPVDLFFSASPDELDVLAGERLLVEGSRRSVATNRLVVVVPADADPPATLEELKLPSYARIALGNPRTAPVGRYAAAALRSTGLLPALESRVVHGENARQVLDYVARGEASAGVVYRTDALLLSDRVRLGPLFPVESHPPILYQAAVLAGSRNPRGAEALLDRLLTPAGQQVLRRHGFGRVR